jgi:hypothetical protein
MRLATNSVPHRHSFYFTSWSVHRRVGFNNPFRINLVIDLFAIGGLGLPLLFGMWPVTVIHALWVILARK